jgi:hypothetical protein
MGALLMAAFKIAITPFLTSFGGGLGSRAAEWVWSKTADAGHQDIAERMQAGTATAEQQKAAQRVVSPVIDLPAQAQELQEVAGTNPVAAPLALNYAALLSTQPAAWTQFATGSSTLDQLAAWRADAFGWTSEQSTYDSTQHCPVGGEPLPLFSAVTFIDSNGKTLLSAWGVRPNTYVFENGEFHRYQIMAACPSGHNWKVYRD